MKISEVKEVLKTVENVNFKLPNGVIIPNHFHVTEVGKISKHFIDCGGTIRTELIANFQLWTAQDFDHRLHPEKFLKILDLSENILGMGDLEIEVEYQLGTINKFGLEFDGVNFVLTNKLTDCLAKDNCGIPEEKIVEVDASDCTPGGGCC